MREEVVQDAPCVPHNISPQLGLQSGSRRSSGFLRVASNANARHLYPSRDPPFGPPIVSSLIRSIRGFSHPRWIDGRNPWQVVTSETTRSYAGPRLKNVSCLAVGTDESHLRKREFMTAIMVMQTMHLQQDSRIVSKYARWLVAGRCLAAEWRET
jgi:hypothetical protein